MPMSPLAGPRKSKQLQQKHLTSVPRLPCKAVETSASSKTRGLRSSPGSPCNQASLSKRHVRHARRQSMCFSPHAHTHTNTHTWTLSLGGVASCTLRSYGVLGLAPRHFTCKRTGRNTCRYAGLIRPSISRGIALFVGQPAMLTGLPPCIVSQSETLCCQRFTHTRTPFSGVVDWLLIRRQTVPTVQTRKEACMCK